MDVSAMGSARRTMARRKSWTVGKSAGLRGVDLGPAGAGSGRAPDSRTGSKKLESGGRRESGAAVASRVAEMYEGGVLIAVGVRVVGDDDSIRVQRRLAVVRV
jgi:hypothetical protein